MSVTFKYAIGEKVHTEDIQGNCCPETVSTSYIVKSFWLFNKTVYYKTERSGTVGELIFEEIDLHPATVHPAYVFPTLFNIGDVAYVKEKAAVGKLVAVFIAQIQVPETYGGIPIVIYKDNTNLLWNEWDLITLAAATTLVNQFCV